MEPNKRLLIRKILTLICSICECLFFGGLTYGWASLVFVLKYRGFFGSHCNQTTVDVGLTENSTITSSVAPLPDCPWQDTRLQLVFTVAAFTINATSFIIGPVYDKYGTRLVRIIFSIFLATAFLLLAFCNPERSIILFPALVLLSSGGIMVLLSNIQVGNLFGRWRSTVVTALSGSFDSSAVMMLFIKIGYSEGISMMTSFIVLACATLAFNINTWLLLPITHIPWPLPKNWGLSEKKVEVEEVIKMEKTPLESNGHSDYNSDAVCVSYADLLEREYPNVRMCFISPLYLLLLLWLSVIQLSHLFFLGTFNVWIENMANQDKDIVSKYTSVFSSIQFCGIFFAPLCGLLLDRNRIKKTSDGKDCSQRTFLDDLEDSILVFVITTILTLIFCLCITIPIMEVQYITFLFQVLSRAFMYGLTAAFLATAFPMHNFGALYGMVMLLSAIFGLIQYPLFIIIQRLCNGESLYVNIAMIVANLFPLVHPLYIYLYVKKRRLEWTRDGTTEVLAVDT